MAKKYAKKTGSTKELKNLKNWENIKRNWQSGNICEKQEVSGQNVWVGISAQMLEDNCVFTY